MSIEPPIRLYSYDDYAALDDGKRYQVVEGELIEMTGPTRRHQRLVRDLAYYLIGWSRSATVGEVYFAPFDVVLRAERPATVLQPDILFVSQARIDILTDKNAQGAPDLVIEVLSPSTARLDTVRKSRLYAQFGVQECWFVSHEFDRIDVWTRTPEGEFGFPRIVQRSETLTSDLLPGFALPLGELFPPGDD